MENQPGLLEPQQVHQEEEEGDPHLQRCHPLRQSLRGGVKAASALNHCPVLWVLGVPTRPCSNLLSPIFLVFHFVLQSMGGFFASKLCYDDSTCG